MGWTAARKLADDERARREAEKHLMQTKPTLRKLIIENVLWFIGALALAVFVWVTAMAQSDPIEQWRLTERVPIRFTPDPGLIITNEDALTSTAFVQLRAPRSVRQIMSADDVQVWANLAGLGAGEHLVELQTRIAADRRARVVNTTPGRVTVQLEIAQAQLKPVEAQITADAPAVVRVDEIAFDALQVTVSGPATRVEQVVKVIVPLDLTTARASLETDVRPLPVDVDGQVVSGVNISPAVIHVTVGISQRSDVREVRVLPNLVGELPEGYVLAQPFDYEPKSIIVNGPAEVLAALPGVVLTAPIDLTDRRASFVLDVPVELPDQRFVILTGRTIQVTVGITAPTTTRQLDRVPVTIIGLRAGLAADLLPNEVTVLITGSQPRLVALTTDDVRVVVDLAAFTAAGTYRVTPLASVADDATLSMAVLPDEIDVQIVDMLDATPEATADAPTG
jgi:YbbR domain-containing protein